MSSENHLIRCHVEISGGIRREKGGTATGGDESQSIVLERGFSRNDLTINGFGHTIGMVLVEALKLGGIFNVEVLPVDKGNYCAIVQGPVTAAPEIAHTIPPISQKDGCELEQSTQRY